MNEQMLIYIYQISKCNEMKEVKLETIEYFAVEFKKYSKKIWMTILYTSSPLCDHQMNKHNKLLKHRSGQKMVSAECAQNALCLARR